MIRSVWQVDFMGATGTARLLDSGDSIDREPTPAVKQSTGQWAELGNPWGGATAQGGAVSEIRFAVRKSHASHAALRDYCMRSAATLQSGHTGVLRLEVLDGAVWEIADVVVSASECSPLLQSAGFDTLQSFVITGGRPVPVTPIALYPGVPVEFILQPVEMLTDPIESY